MNIDLYITIKNEHVPRHVVFREGTEKRWHELVGQYHYLHLLGLKIPVSKEDASVIQSAIMAEKKGTKK